MSENDSTEPAATAPTAPKPAAPEPAAPGNQPAPTVPTESATSSPYAPAATPPAAVKPRNGLGLAAMIIAIVACFFALIPGVSFIAFIPALAALGLGIAGLVSKRGSRGQALTAVIVGPVALLIAIFVSIGTVASTITPDLSANDDPAVQAPADEPDEPAEADAEEEEPEPAPVAEGTRQNPASAGSTIVISDNTGPIWEITLDAATLNANDIIANENMFNEAPDAGHQYVMVPVTYTYVGTESGTPWIDVQIAFVSAAGTTHENTFAVAPSPVTEINELYPDASASGNFVVMAPSDNIEGGAWAISTFLSDKYFVAVV